MENIRLQISDFKPQYSQKYSVGAMVVDDSVEVWTDDKGEEHSSLEFDNEFGEGHYIAKPGDIVLEGTQGEHWIVPQAKFQKKYELDGKEIDMGTIAKGSSLADNFTTVATKDSKAITWAVQISEADAQITTPEGQQLTANNSAFQHGGGDFICCSDDGGKPSFEWGCWPVNGSVFVNTYELADIEYDLDFHEADDLLSGEAGFASSIQGQETDSHDTISSDDKNIEDR